MKILCNNVVVFFCLKSEERKVIGLDIEQKLELIQQMHREQEENEFQDLDLQTSWSVSFRFRLLVAVLLFLCFYTVFLFPECIKHADEHIISSISFCR